MKKKIIIITTISLFLISLFVLLVFYLNYYTVNSYSAEFQKLAIDNGLATEENFTSCKQSSKNCIAVSFLYIKNNLVLRADYTNYDMSKLSKAMDEANALISNQKYKGALGSIGETITSVNQNYNRYVKDNQSNFNAIDKAMEIKTLSLDFFDINYRIVGRWALVTQLPENGGDIANTILQKNNDKTWTIAIGPGSYFEKSSFVNFPGLPEKIKDNANDIRPNVIVFNPDNKAPTQKGSLINEAPFDPLSERLPFTTSQYTVESKYVKGLPVYTVSYYTVGGNTLEKTKTSFRKWLQEIGIKIDENSVKYVPLEAKEASKESD